MSYATRYHFSHRDPITTSTWRVNIKQDGFVGSATELVGSNIKLVYDQIDPRNPFDNPIQGSRLIASIMIRDSSDRAIFDALSIVDETEYQLELLENGTTRWTGFLLPDLIEFQEDINVPVSLTARDIILDGKEFALSTGNEKAITLLASMLSQFGLGLDIRTHTSWIEDSLTSTDDILNQVYHNKRRLRKYATAEGEIDRPLNLKEALESVLNTYRLILRQSNNKWELFQLSQLNSSSHEIWDYNSSGGSQVKATTSFDISINNTERWLTGKSLNKRYAALKRVEFNFDHESKVQGIIIPSRQTIDEDQVYTQFFQSDGGQNLELTVTTIETFTTGLNPSVDITLQVGSYYWNGTAWTTSIATNTINLDAYSIENIDGSNDLYGQFAISIITDNLPTDADGTLTVTLGHASGAVETTYNGLSFSIKNSSVETGDSVSIDYQLEQSGSYSKTLSLPALKFGEGPSLNSYSALLDSSGNILDGWRRRGEGSSITHAQLNLRELLDGFRTSRRYLRGVLPGDFRADKIISYDSSRFFFLGGELNVSQSGWRVDLLEISYATGSDTFTAFYNADNESSGQASAGTSSSGGNVIGSDVQAYDEHLDQIAGLTPTDSNFIVGNGSAWVAESGATARASLGLGSLATLSSINNSNWSGADLSIANGGTGASTEGTARSALGLAIGSDVQAWSSNLDSINQDLGTTDSPTFSGGTFSGAVNINNILTVDATTTSTINSGNTNVVLNLESEDGTAYLNLIDNASDTYGVLVGVTGNEFFLNHGNTTGGGLTETFRVTKSLMTVGIASTFSNAVTVSSGGIDVTGDAEFNDLITGNVSSNYLDLNTSGNSTLAARGSVFVVVDSDGNNSGGHFLSIMQGSVSGTEIAQFDTLGIHLRTNTFLEAAVYFDSATGADKNLFFRENGVNEYLFQYDSSANLFRLFDYDSNATVWQHDQDTDIFFVGKQTQIGSLSGKKIQATGTTGEILFVSDGANTNNYRIRANTSASVDGGLLIEDGSFNDIALFRASFITFSQNTSIDGNLTLTGDNRKLIFDDTAGGTIRDYSLRAEAGVLIIADETGGVITKASFGNATTTLTNTSIILDGQVIVDTNTNAQPLLIARNQSATEGLTIGIDDNYARFDLTQDESSSTTHRYLFDIQSSATGALGYDFDVNGSTLFRVHNDTGALFNTTLSVSNTTNATSSSVASVELSGGLGIAKDIFISSTSDIYSDDFNAGGSTGWIIDGGAGFGMSNDATTAEMWIDDLTVRGRLRVFELIIKQIATIGGTEIMTVAAGIVQSTGGAAPFETVTIEDPRGFGGTAFKANDMVIVQQVDFNANNGGQTGLVVKQEFRRVVSVSGTSVVLGTLTGAPSSSDRIEPGDAIVAFGSTTDADRQSIIYRNVEGSPIIRVQTGVNSYSDFSDPVSTTKVGIGDLNGLVTGISSAEYGLAAGDMTLSGNHILFTDAQSSIKVDVFSLSAGDLTISSDPLIQMSDVDGRSVTIDDSTSFASYTHSVRDTRTGSFTSINGLNSPDGTVTRDSVTLRERVYIGELIEASVSWSYNETSEDTENTLIAVYLVLKEEGGETVYNEAIDFIRLTSSGNASGTFTFLWESVVNYNPPSNDYGFAIRLAAVEQGTRTGTVSASYTLRVHNRETIMNKGGFLARRNEENYMSENEIKGRYNMDIPIVSGKTFDDLLPYVGQIVRYLDTSVSGSDATGVTRNLRAYQVLQVDEV